MATLTLEDQSGSTSVVVFPDVFTSHASLLAGDTPVLVTGTAEVNENAAKILAQEIVSLETVRQQSIRAIEVDLPGERVSRDTLETLRDIFYRYPGECSVLFRVSSGNGKVFLVSASDHYRVFPCDEMIEEIESLTGRKVLWSHGNQSSNTGKS
jgi:DNA polymerase III alpha subunit